MRPARSTASLPISVRSSDIARWRSISIWRWFAAAMLAASSRACTGYLFLDALAFTAGLFAQTR